MGNLLIKRQLQAATATATDIFMTPETCTTVRTLNVKLGQLMNRNRSTATCNLTA
jgi:hypothetical protein